jgi:predicted RNA-binding protein Jag
MVDFLQLQEIIRGQLAQDRSIRIVTASAPTLEEAVSQAAILLNVPVRRLEYEIGEKGSPGIFGSGKKDWTINAYQQQAAKSESDDDMEFDTDAAIGPIIEDLDGDAFVHLNTDGVFLKVIPPSGNGRKMTEENTLKMISDRHVSEINEELVGQIVKEARGEYKRVGSFDQRPMNDSMVLVDIPEGEMKAYIAVSPPGIGGCDISVETYLSFLRNNRVVHGVDEEFLRHFADRPTYKEKVAVAEGTRPVNGRDAYIQYNFETDQSRMKFREGANGRIDFKDLNIIKNVFKSQPLAIKILHEDGVPGKTVSGKIIPAKNGKDIPLPLGKNVHLGDDGVTVIADINGQVVLAAGKIKRLAISKLKPASMFICLEYCSIKIL